MNTYGNPILEQLPNHLKQYVVDQHYERYTPVDQAVWRYVMRQNYSYLKDVAYYPYIPGLRKAGISIEEIPHLQQMNDHLQQIGWGAVTVDGFIPPVTFMEFQAYHVLVIAADIRQLEHIAYTPAPDIIHESSGHAPIIAEKAYAEYLNYFGKVGAKAMFSFKDFQQYEAIRKLSILKEQANATDREIKEAEDHLIDVQQHMGEPSEMALLSRLHWWTVEYGLIGTLENPKIYGAGLLSSIGESVSCMRADVKKLPYNLNTVNYPYDITKPQPQLFVTPSFEHLLDVLNNFANTMAFRVGGKESVEKAIECKNVCTVVYSSGLQISGIFVSANNQHSLTYVQTKGPTALAVNNKQINGHAKERHSSGFGSPVGKLVDHEISLEDFTDELLQSTGIIKNQEVQLEFTSGIKVSGIVKNILYRYGKIVLISLSQCTVRNITDEAVYFRPEWGDYEMAVGEKIVSVFCGAADKNAYEETIIPTQTIIPSPNYSKETQALHQLYQHVRDIRTNKSPIDQLPVIWEKLSTHYPKEWLCPLEILELLLKHDELHEIAHDIKHYLLTKATQETTLSKLIHDGLQLAARNNYSTH
ncbi:aromatic amino acid hydroxylase [Olivibacter sp. SDN3]|uniref:aromatic amino acid hydroxylase n=1 Tax=Olivibacter sp. SDN3 TaxID=2764720 RepID=UPI0016511396|nr:aromatic amino acid hydroxylase [Olivibacter sp. SDN3]QNL48347.1 aromatic amino acid hydroxylase [Olivibacter sp. SDN3]